MSAKSLTKRKSRGGEGRSGRFTHRSARIAAFPLNLVAHQQESRMTLTWITPKGMLRRRVRLREEDRKKTSRSQGRSRLEELKEQMDSPNVKSERRDDERTEDVGDSG